MILSAFAQFSRGQQQFTLRVPLELEVILRNAGDPTPLDKGVGGPDIKWIVTDRDLAVLNGGWAKFVGPVIHVVDFDAPSWLDLRRPFGCRGEREETEGVIVVDGAVNAFSTPGHACSECFTWTEI